MCEFPALIIPKDYTYKVQQIELLCQCFKYKLFYINLMKNPTHQIFGSEPDPSNIKPKPVGLGLGSLSLFSCQVFSFHVMSVMFHFL